MDNLYTYTDVKELEFKDFNNKEIKENVNNNKFGFIIFYSPNCNGCKKSVYFWAEMYNLFINKFNIFAYNIDNFKTKNEKIREYLSFPIVPLIISVPPPANIMSSPVVPSMVSAAEVPIFVTDSVKLPPKTTKLAPE